MACQVLLLGCGDIRNALLTAATLSQRGAKQVAIHLNDVNDVILARAALLLALADGTDPGKAEDVQFLFAVWYCAALSPQHAERLRQAVQKLVQLAADDNVCSSSSGRVDISEGAAGPGGADARGRSGADVGLQQRLLAIWRAWLDGTMTVEEMARDR